MQKKTAGSSRASGPHKNAQPPGCTAAVGRPGKALYMRIKRLYERYKDHLLLVDDPIELRKARLLAYKQKRRM